MKNSKFTIKNSFKVLLVLAALSVFAVSCFKQVEKTKVTLTAVDRGQPLVQEISNKNYSRFNHSVSEHVAIDCDSCHKREDDPLKLEYPGHNSCINCHLSEYTNPQSNICASCHDNLKVVPSTMKAFPATFNEGFNMMFDHAAHESGAGRPKEGCASCHKPEGAGQTIPAGIKTHSTCFTCHTPESSIGSCSECHKLAPYKRTVPSSKLFKAVFRHSDHTSRQGVNCNECHTVKANAPQSKQIDAPIPVQHFPEGNVVSCRTCHNEKRAFGEEDFANCKLCHKGDGFDLIPDSFKAK